MNNGGIVKVAGTAYKNRRHIVRTWQWIDNKLRGEKKTIAFTGVSGAGKTVLFDYLSGIAYKQGYAPPVGSSQKVDRSQETVEKDKLRNVPKRRIARIVIPGAESQPRFEAMEDLLKKRHEVCGIVHVVCMHYSSTSWTVL